MPFISYSQSAWLTALESWKRGRGADLLLQVEPCKSLGAEMDLSMAYTAKRDEIFFYIACQEAPRLNVMDLEILGTSASLASPAIALEYLPAQPLISRSLQTKPGLF